MNMNRIEWLIEQTVTFGRTQLDWDIEDAAYELRGETKEERQARELRRHHRALYVLNLHGNIRHAISK
jgi:hypothetical protein